MLLEVAPLNTLRGQRNRTPHAKLSLRASPARSSPTIVVRLLGVDLPSTETTHPDLCSLHAPSQDSANRSASEGVLGAMVRPASVSPLVLTPLLNSPPPLYSLQPGEHHGEHGGNSAKFNFTPCLIFCRPGSCVASCTREAVPTCTPYKPRPCRGACWSKGGGGGGVYINRTFERLGRRKLYGHGRASAFGPAFGHWPKNAQQKSLTGHREAL